MKRSSPQSKWPKWRGLFGLGIVASGFAAVACTDDASTAFPVAPAEPAANVAHPSLLRRAPVPLRDRQAAARVGSRRRGLSPEEPLFALATATTVATCAKILIYDNNTHFARAREAVTGMGLTFTHAVASDFNTKLTGETWDLVIMDLPSTQPTGEWQTGLINHIQAGGRAIHTHWDNLTLTTALQAAFEINNPVVHQVQNFHRWNAHPLFATPNPVPSTFVGAEVQPVEWADNGFAVSPTGSAVAAAGFTTSPAAGQAAIVIGNSGRTIFNGFLFDDYNPADADEDEQKDIEELIQNEVEHTCGAPGETENETTERVESGDEATVTVSQACTTGDENSDGQCEVAGTHIEEGTTFRNANGDAVDVNVRVKLVERGEPGEDCPHALLMGQDPQDACVKVEITIAEGEVGAGSEPTFSQPIEIGLCRKSGLSTGVDLWQWETRLGLAEPTEEAPAAFLECAEFQGASAAPTNWLEGLAMRVGKRVKGFLTPKPLYAADGGFGGFADHTSTFGWASALQVTSAGLAIDVFDSGKDAFGVASVFGLEAKGFEPFELESGFDPAVHTVVVGYGKGITQLAEGIAHWKILPGSWKFVSKTGRWTYTSRASTGINYMDIHPTTGEFRVAGNRLTGGDALPTHRQFVVQIGHRLRGALLHCSSNRSCSSQH